MKKIILASVLVLLTGCSSQTSEKIENEGIKANIQTTATSGSGEICGGDSEKLCGRGFECLISEDPSEDHGYCIAQQWNEEAECTEVHEPLCGVRGTRKNGFQNECFAQKWGAEKISDGFCRKDETIVGSCEAQVLGLEGCFNIFEGYEFNGNECVKKRVFGCDAEKPFESLEACQKTCQ